MSEYLDTPPSVAHACKSIMANRPYNGVSYANLQAYGTGLVETTDPEFLGKPYYCATYWPGRIPDMPASQFAAVLIEPPENNQENYARLSALREQVLGLKLSRRAVRRWHDSLPGLAEQIGYTPTAETDSAIPDICAAVAAPMSAVLLMEVIRHKKIKAGQSIASVYFPAIMHSPTVALEWLQAAQQGAIDEERL